DPAAQVLCDELSGLLREIEQDRARFEHRDGRPAARRIMIHDGGNPVVGRDLQERALELVSLTDIHGENLIRQSGLFEKNRHLVAVRRRPVLHVDHVTGCLGWGIGYWGFWWVGGSVKMISDHFAALATRLPVNFSRCRYAGDAMYGSIRAASPAPRRSPPLPQRPPVDFHQRRARQ